jgi:hypothetical protein
MIKVVINRNWIEVWHVDPETQTMVVRSVQMYSLGAGAHSLMDKWMQLVSNGYILESDLCQMEGWIVL